MFYVLCFMFYVLCFMQSMTVSVNGYAKETAYRLSTFIKHSFQQITLKV
jgi:alanyl aminopeptidase